MGPVVEELLVRVHGDASLPTLVYLPGLHGDWTLVTSFRAAVAGRVRFVEFTYPRTVTWSLEDYADAIESALIEHGIDRGWLLGESFGSQPAWRLIARTQERQREVAESGLLRTSRSDGREPGDTVERVPTGAAIQGTPGASLPRVPPAGLVGTDSTPSLESNGGVVEHLATGVASEDALVTRPQSTIRHPQRPRHFQPEGLILAGGFVRHPVIPGVCLMRRLNAALPRWALQSLFRLYAGYARFRHRHATETFDCLGEFVANRLAPGDQAAIVHRLDLIANHDPRPIARQTRIPVYYLAGLVDPLVPWPFVRRWLGRHCPGYRGGKTILNADHNVLGTAPQAAACLVFGWMTGERGLCD